MAPSKVAILSIFLALIFSQIRSDREQRLPAHETTVTQSDGPHPVKNWRHSLVKSIKTTASHISGKIKGHKKNTPRKNGVSPEEYEKLQEIISSMELQLKKDDELKKENEKEIQHNLDTISSLRSEIESLQVNELEQKLQSQSKEKEDLESRANEAEKKINDLLSEIQNTRKTNDEQETKIRKTEHALEVKVAEVNELEKELQSQRIEKGDLKDRVNEAVQKINDLLSKIESVNKLEKELQSQRSEKGNLKDCVNEAEKKIDYLLSKIENALEKKAQAEKWAEPHVETAKTKWISAIKEQWVVVKETVELHVISLSNKTIEVFEVSKTTLAPHVIKAQEVVDLYFQEAKKFSKPYVDQLTTVTKPHVDKAVIAYEKILKSASTYHHQVQGTVKDLLKRHELTRPLATKELEWFAASALVALLIIILFRIFSSLFCTKTKKPVPGTNHARRNAKRGHPEK